jgi:hypothetical protein
VEVNSVIDELNHTINLAAELISSAFGKKQILYMKKESKKTGGPRGSRTPNQGIVNLGLSP